MSKKVFGIGFHKTGTKSLGAALDTLGYRVTGPNWTRETDIADTALDRARALLPHYDAFQDNPWPILFREMDALCPGAKFVLTTCPTDEWIARVERYFGAGETPMRRWIYDEGSPIGHLDRYVEVYEAHNRAVLEHFKDRPDDLLVFPLTTDPSWERLCHFLGHAVPRAPFPHANRGQ
jgi:hypothetical protein